MVVRELLAQKLPRLNAHLETHGIDVSLVTFNWMLTVFSDAAPMEVSAWEGGHAGFMLGVGGGGGGENM